MTARITAALTLAAALLLPTLTAGAQEAPAPKPRPDGCERPASPSV